MKLKLNLYIAKIKMFLKFVMTKLLLMLLIITLITAYICIMFNQISLLLISIGTMISIIYFNVQIYQTAKIDKELFEMKNVNKFMQLVNYNMTYMNVEEEIVLSSLKDIKKDDFFKKLYKLYRSNTTDRKNIIERKIRKNDQFFQMFMQIFNVAIYQTKGENNSVINSLNNIQVLYKNEFLKLRKTYEKKNSSKNTIRSIIILFMVVTIVLKFGLKNYWNEVIITNILGILLMSFLIIGFLLIIIFSSKKFMKNELNTNQVKSSIFQLNRFKLIDLVQNYTKISYKKYKKNMLLLMAIGFIIINLIFITILNLFVIGLIISLLIIPIIYVNAKMKLIKQHNKYFGDLKYNFPISSLVFMNLQPIYKTNFNTFVEVQKYTTNLALKNEINNLLINLNDDPMNYAEHYKTFSNKINNDLSLNFNLYIRNLEEKGYNPNLESGFKAEIMDTYNSNFEDIIEKASVAMVKYLTLTNLVFMAFSVFLAIILAYLMFTNMMGGGY